MSQESLKFEDVNPEKLLEIFEIMFRIRSFEERVRKEFEAGNLPGFVHLYAGQEATAAGISANLRTDDVITSTHRGHGHAIAKGLDTKFMFAELKGAAAGLCKGKGGSMHVTDVTKGMLGANAVVGAGLPIATGAALGFKYNGVDNVSICYFGDGASNQGTFHESINLGAIWKLPVIYVCDNNGYAEQTPINYHLSAKNVSDRAASYSIPGILVDASEVLQVYSAAKTAIERARRGKGPTLIDSRGHRLYGHFVGDDQKYKSKEEFDSYSAYDPLKKFKRQIAEKALVSNDQIEEIETRIMQEIEAGWRFGEQSELPRPEETSDDVYVKYP